MPCPKALVATSEFERVSMHAVREALLDLSMGARRSTASSAGLKRS